MAQAHSIVTTAAVLLLGWAPPALALDAEEIWAEWQRQSAAMGQIVSTAQVTPRADGLTLTGYATRYSDGDVTTVVEIDEVVLTESGDGRVIITTSQTYDIMLGFRPDAFTPPVEMRFALHAPELRVVASGTAEARGYDYAAPRLTLEEGPISGGAGALPVIDLTVQIADLVARYEMSGSDPADLRYASVAAIGGMTAAASLAPPAGEEGYLKLSLALGPATSAGRGRLGSLQSLGTAGLPKDILFERDIRHDGARLEVTFAHPDDGFTLLTSNAGGSVSAGLSGTEARFGFSATAVETYFAARELPLPVSFGVGTAELALRLPLAAAAQPQDFAARLAYRDVAVAPDIWALVDPMQAIPRDPITAIVDLTGTARILRDLLGGAPGEMADIPAELVTLRLDALRIAVAGAELTGNGAAEFAPGPVPVPVGAVDLQLRGINALFDRLQAAGLVPIEQLAMARGLLGAFARPGATPDTLETRLEFTQGGGITANGVPLR